MLDPEIKTISNFINGSNYFASLLNILSLRTGKLQS